MRTEATAEQAQSLSRLLDRIHNSLPGELSPDRTIRVNTMKEFSDVIKRFGHLITPSLAAQFVGCAREWIYRLVDDGRLRKIVVYGVIHVPLTQVNKLVYERMQRSEREKSKEKRVGAGE